MDISKNGNVSNTKYPGNVLVKGKVTTNELNVENNVDIQGILSVKDIVIDGKNLSETLKDNLSENLTETLTGKLTETLTENLTETLTGKLTENLTETLTGKLTEKLKEINSNKDFLYLGNDSEDGSWRFRILNGELLIEKLEEGEWSIKQSIE